MDDCEVVPLGEDYQDPETELKQVEKDITTVTQEIQILQGRKQRLLKKREKLRDSIQQQKSTYLAQKDWERQDFAWSDELEKLRKSVFGINDLRPHQLPTMNATLSGTDCILIMPTGGGKSLCYQLPALVSKGITVVVSPLVSLMEDQLMGLRGHGVEAKMLCADSPKDEVNAVHFAMTDLKTPLKLIYVTPERLAKSKRFMAKLQKMHQIGQFARLAIDEVHCCSQWGHDFRPDYKFLGIMRKMFPGTPILGLTATATSRVILDVQKILDIQGCLILKASFNRPNLFYEVHPKPSSPSECVDELEKLLKGQFKDQSGIIYTLSIKDTEELAKELRGRDIKVAPYHAQLPSELRSKIHRKWVENIYQVVVATIAFGMGIDKPDVRFVIHHCISKSMENFYQESGRAGRDNKPAKCIVFWRFADFARQSTMVFTEQTGLDNLYGLITYCFDSLRCRRNIIAEHFDERWEASDCNGMCDHCRTPREVKNLDITKYGEQLLMILTKASSKDQRLTGQKLIDAWLGKGAKDIRVQDAIASDLTRDKAENIIAFLLIDGFLKEDFHFTPYSTISYIVLGPKGEAGLSPSPMQVGGRRKDIGYSNANSNVLLKEKSKMEAVAKYKNSANVQVKNNALDKTTDRKKLNVSEKKKKSDSSVQKSSQFNVSDNQARKKQKTQLEDSKVTSNSTSVHSKVSSISADKDNNANMSTDESNSVKRKRIITIDDSSDEFDSDI